MSHLSSSLTPLQRADELLRTMTIEEKAFQLSSIMPIGLFGAEGLIESQLEKLLGMGIGHIAALPTLLVYVIAGRYFVRGLTAGAVKG